MIARIHRAMEEKDEGFTLIELLVVIIIIGILAAIAIPIFLNQRTKGWKSAAESDARNAAIAEEAYNTSTGDYANLSATTSAVVTLGTGSNAETVNLSENVQMTITGGPNSYCITAVYLENGAANEATRVHITPTSGGVQDGGC